MVLPAGSRVRADFAAGGGIELEAVSGSVSSDGPEMSDILRVLSWLDE